jgi:hypothetical protein
MYTFTASFKAIDELLEDPPKDVDKYEQTFKKALKGAQKAVIHL